MKEVYVQRQRRSSPPHTATLLKRDFKSVSEWGIRCLSATSRRLPLVFRLSFPYKCPMGEAQSGSSRPRTSSSAKTKKFVCYMFTSANFLREQMT